MSDVSGPRDIDADLVSFKYPLPHLKAALQSQEKIRIVAIGSSSTAGVAPVLPYPPRLEMLLRQKFANPQFPNQMIDVINRGIGGQEAPDELLRFQSVFDEAPALVIWQVGTNAIFHDMDRSEVAAKIEEGLQQLSGLTADVVLMDLQYTKAMVDKLKASKEMVTFIAAAAEKAKVNVFRRFALMQRWVDDQIPIDALEDGDPSHLHTGEWATYLVSRLLSDAIERAVKAVGTT